MWKINDILKGTAHLTPQQCIPKQVEKSDRCIDALLSQNVQHFLAEVNGNLIKKSCEFKPISRAGSSYEKMIQRGLNQTLGHNLQVLWDSCFQFCGGLGKDGKVSGIVLTMVSASLMDSSLSGVGTKTMDLKISGVKNQPLFSEKTTRKLSKGVEFQSLGLKFCPDTPMQPGFIALVDFITKEGEPEEDVAFELCQPDKDTISVNEFQYLGSGAFSSVYQCSLSDNTQTVLKMNKNWDSSVLTQELTALKDLTHEAIPKLFGESLVRVMVKARCERNVVMGLLLKLDRGLSVQQLCKTPTFADVKNVLNAIEGVLDYAHQKSWFHLDVQPSNIIAVDDSNGRRYILIDWGMAVKGDKVLKAFHGSPPFTHPSMFLVKNNPEDKDKWKGPKPEAEFDKFSLAMTLAYIEHKGVPWSGFHGKVVTNEMLEDRRSIAVKLIECSPNLDEIAKTKVLEWVSKPAHLSSQQKATGQVKKGVNNGKRKRKLGRSHHQGGRNERSFAE